MNAAAGSLEQQQQLSAAAGTGPRFITGRGSHSPLHFVLPGQLLLIIHADFCTGVTSSGDPSS